MATPQDILAGYEKLRDYCDRFWKRVVDTYADQCACASGCGICCTLTSVTCLEAAIIADFSRKNKPPPQHAVPGAATPGPEGSCPFLMDNRCSIYPARPLICRTHGLLLRNVNIRERIMPSCPYNFATTELADIDDSFALDSEKISINLARLNAAYCMLLGDKNKATGRIKLSDLAAGSLPDSPDHC